METTTNYNVTAERFQAAFDAVDGLSFDLAKAQANAGQDAAADAAARHLQRAMAEVKRAALAMFPDAYTVGEPAMPPAWD